MTFSGTISGPDLTGVLQFRKPARAELPRPQDKHIDDECEQAVLGGMMLDDAGCVAEAVAERLTPADFADARHQAIYKAILAAHERGEASSPLTLRPTFEGNPDFKELGGAKVYLIRLASEGADKRGQIRDRARHLRRLADKRRALDVADAIRDAVDASPIEAEPADLLRPATEALEASRAAAPRRHLTDAAELVMRKFAPVRYVVEPFLVEGFTILAGPPKIGKSWLSLDFGLSIATDTDALGTCEVTAGNVLVLALEDTERRLHDRLRKLLDGRSIPPGRLTLATEWRKLDEGGLDDIAAWCDQAEAPRCVIVDTLAKVRGKEDRTRGIYGNDYAANGGLKSLGDARRIAVIGVHHLRKGTSDDPLEQVSGSTGLTGQADTIMVLKRGRSAPEGTLFVTGRDIGEREDAIAFDGSTGHWRLLGDAEEFRRSEQRNAIIRCIQENGPIAPKDIAGIIGMKAGGVRSMLLKLKREGIVSADNKGRYIA